MRAHWADSTSGGQTHGHPATEGVGHDARRLHQSIERKLMDCLNRLGYDIEIKVRPAAGADRASNARNLQWGALLMAARITDDEWDERLPRISIPRHCCVQSMPWTCCAAI